VCCHIHRRSHDNDGIWTRNRRELTKLISEKIGTIEGVKRICPAVILEIIERIS